MCNGVRGGVRDKMMCKRGCQNATKDVCLCERVTICEGVCVCENATKDV